MNWITNPFAELYPTERIRGDEFVGLFSSSLINSATNLYGKGNTILEGVQGSGKSMLLALLKPEIRLAYMNSGEDFPVPREFSNFISAGINLTQDGAKSFSNLRPGRKVREWQSDLPLYFADYFNYMIVRDIFKTLSLYRGRSSEELFGVTIDVREEKLNSFAKTVSKNDCWFDYLDDVGSFEDLNSRIEERLKEYRFLLNLNRTEPSEDLRTSKTVIACPIFEVISALKDAGVVSSDTNFIVYVDQYEELDHMCIDDKDILSEFRRIINQALHYRDDRVAFKIGTRGYAWKSNIDVYNSFVKIEEGRDYNIIRIYDLLRRREHAGSMIFKELCYEVFTKRLRRAGIDTPADAKDILEYVFGNTPTADDKARLYAGDKPEKTLRFDAAWPKPWVDFLKELSVEDPLSAHLGAAWSRQKHKSDVIVNIPKLEALPWQSNEKKYWRKERVQQSLIQMASNKQQATLLFGPKDIMGVSGANILAFLTVCQKIWSIYIASATRSKLTLQSLPKELDRNIQSAGIKEASRVWFEKISELPGGGERKRFVKNLGQKLSKDFVKDLPMSNPGQTGVSFSSDDLGEAVGLMKVLDECVDYSLLDRKDHTTKLADRKPRVKYYIEPILCPFFKLPYQQTKEPAYFRCEDIIPLVDAGYMADKKHEQLGLDL